MEILWSIPINGLKLGIKFQNKWPTKNHREKQRDFSRQKWKEISPQRFHRRRVKPGWLLRSSELFWKNKSTLEEVRQSIWGCLTFEQKWKTQLTTSNHSWQICWWWFVLNPIQSVQTYKIDGFLFSEVFVTYLQQFMEPL